MLVNEAPERIKLPDAAFARAVESVGEGIGDAVARLRYLRLCCREVEEVSPALRRGPMRGWGDRMTALDCLLRSGAATGRRVGLGDRLLLTGFRRASNVYRLNQILGLRRATAGAAALLVVLAVGVATSPRWPSRIEDPVTPAGALAEKLPAPALGIEIWLVESSEDAELYSNGLRISNEFLHHGAERRYLAAEIGPGSDPLQSLEDAQWRSRPVGIVYHTTVSEIAPPLEKRNNQLIRYRGKKLLAYMAREKFYNFVIDRFGRVFRTTPEDETAFHAGASMWADGSELYLNLNESFIGAAFETRPEALAPGAGPQESVTEAQFSAARLLTAMLRDKFGIAERNCVTHEMVSLNPSNMLIGNHTDWIGRFPFERVGLPDNYQIPPPSVAEWGFDYDSQFLADLGGRVWPGVGKGQLAFRKQATARGLSAGDYRREKRREYKRLLARLRAIRPDGAAPDGAPRLSAAREPSRAKGTRSGHEGENRR